MTDSYDKKQISRGRAAMSDHEKQKRTKHMRITGLVIFLLGAAVLILAMMPV